MFSRSLLPRTDCSFTFKLDTLHEITKYGSTYWTTSHSTSLSFEWNSCHTTYCTCIDSSVTTLLDMTSIPTRFFPWHKTWVVLFFHWMKSPSVSRCLLPRPRGSHPQPNLHWSGGNPQGHRMTRSYRHLHRTGPTFCLCLQDCFTRFSVGRM
jgi:hypothetical protein